MRSGHHANARLRCRHPKRKARLVLGRRHIKTPSMRLGNLRGNVKAEAKPFLMRFDDAAVKGFE